MTLTIRAVPRLSTTRASLVVLAAVVAVVGWQGVTTIGRDFSLDARAHLAYTQYFGHHLAPPPASDNYEFSNPPLFAIVALAAEGAVRVLPSYPLELGQSGLARALWLALVAAGAFALTRAGRRLRLAGTTALGLATVWGLDEALSLGKTQSWVSGQLVSLGAAVGLVVVTVMIAEELWPGRRWRALGVGAVVALYPIVLRLGILFHPETTFALLAGATVLLVLRAARTGWSVRLGVAAGLTCGLAAWTRASALAVAVSLFTVAALAGGRRARGFVVAAVVALAVVAGPWWIVAYHLWGNPLESNLSRPGYMLAHGEPASFYVSAPLRSLILHPYRPDFQNEFWPKLHAELWSDWFGGLHHLWADPSRLGKVTASTQSALGFVFDLLALGGLAVRGVPAALRVARKRTASADSDIRWAMLSTLAVASFAVYAFTVVRFPQAEGDPIKTSYLLFTAPCWAAFTVAAWASLRRRSRKAHRFLAVVALLYLGSYGAMLGGAFT